MFPDLLILSSLTSPASNCIPKTARIPVFWQHRIEGAGALPELPEVETMVRGIRPYVEGRKITAQPVPLTVPDNDAVLNPVHVPNPASSPVFWSIGSIIISCFILVPVYSAQLHIAARL